MKITNLLDELNRRLKTAGKKKKKTVNFKDNLKKLPKRSTEGLKIWKI